MKLTIAALTACLIAPFALAAGSAPTAAPERAGDPFPLATCPISGKKLEAEAVVKVYDGREVRFCCNSCPAKFEKDQAKSLAQIDAKLIKDQLPLYPLKTSLVSKKPLPEKPTDFVWGNRLVRVADADEKQAFLKEPAKFIADLDKATADAQRPDYPSKTCLVGGDELGSMGEPKEMVVAGRLFRLCCSHCKSDLNDNPAKFIAKLDEARKGKGATPAAPAPKPVK